MVNFGESAPFVIARNAKAQDAFRIRSQFCSLKQMLDGHLWINPLGGTVHHAFLSGENCHRWHSPVSGTVKMIHHVEALTLPKLRQKDSTSSGPTTRRATSRISLPRCSFLLRG